MPIHNEDQGSCRQIPYAAEQGIFSGATGNLVRSSREFSATTLAGSIERDAA